VTTNIAGAWHATKIGKHCALCADSERVLRQLVRDLLRAIGGARNVLTWIMWLLAVWLSVGALTALLFGTFVSGGL
jgi:hypothetical protein